MEFRKLLASLALSGAALFVAGCPAPPEDCTATGDEDGNGFADCDDVACEAFPDCQEVDEICNDGQDNDGDGTVDCADGDCVNAPNCQEVEVCDNGVDDDGDGVADCADIDCAADPVCLGEICDDTIDNDGDGDTDCGDADCTADPACVELDCDDRTDNDGDGAEDCEDADCAADPVCLPEANCDDNLDNDSDGDVDCADADCAADPICVPDTCGNGAIDAGEDCDGADLGGDDCTTVGGGFTGGILACAANCTFDTAGCTAPGCGNGLVEAGETCDDGNAVDGDGCSALCQLEGVLNEIEPNDDGTPDTGGAGTNGNDFDATAAQILTVDVNAGDAIIAGALNPAGDEDGFALVNNGTNSVVITAQTFGPDGIGTCNGLDTELNFRDAAGTELANDDDGGVNACSLETFTLAPNSTVFVHVIDFGDTDVENLYFLQLSFTALICGDGTVAAGEPCDDGNTTAGDGCSELCQIEGGFSCAGSPSVCVPSCGNGTVNAGESCDDGNVVDGDGCSALCQIEGAVNEIEPNDDGTPNTGGGGTNGNDFDSTAAQILGFDAVNGDVTVVAALNPVGDEDGFAITNTGSNPFSVTGETFGPDGIGTCNGIDTELNFRDAAGVELANDDDGGVNACSLETITLNPGETIFAHVIDFGDSDIENLYFLQLRFEELVCGNGTLAPGEGCDDGNTNDGDGCDSLCQIEPGFVCAGEPSVCAVACGNGVVDAGETCDDANAVAGDGCSDVCVVEPGFACTGTPSICVIACGNGTVDAGETCDDGNVVDGDGCSAICQLEGVLNEIEPNDDGTPNTGGGGTNGNDFDADAALNNPIGIFDVVAGDILIAASLNPAGDEDGFAITNTGSNPFSVTGETFGPGGVGTCVGIDTELNFRDAAGVELANDDDGGVNACSLETITLNPGETIFAHVIDFGDSDIENLYFLQLRFVEVICGSGTLDTGEGCDDGNAAAGDGCSDLCQIEPGFVCAGEPSVCTFVCGNGVVDAGETCDDANNTDGDGCDSLCAVEPGFSCTGAPSVCAPSCGNGALNAGETCDDGNVIDGDGCDSLCQLEGVLTEIEPNDDGTPNTGGGGTNGNDFDSAAAQILGFDAVDGDVIIAAALNPAGDEDGFIIINSGTNPFSVTGETFGPDGVGTCNGLDTELNFRDAAGVELANDDDGGVGTCSLETITLNPGEEVFAHVIDFGDTDVENLYFLQLRFEELVCGNGALAPGEGCDDGNNTAGDGCSDLCQIEPGFVCAGEPSVCTFVCGNGVVDAGETCDDANNTDGDGCDSLCAVEPGFSCTGAPSVCSQNLACGPGETLVSFAAPNVPVAIPDNPTVLNVLSVADAGTISKVFVTLDNLVHTFDADLDIFLLSPAGTSIELSTDNGAGGDNFIGTIFSEDCPNAINGGAAVGAVAPFTGCFNPEGNLNNLAGQSITGDWTLSIDDDAAGDIGTLNAWTLSFCVAP